MATWNVQGRVGDWQDRHAAIVAVLDDLDPDVVALQESWVTSDGGTQAEQMAAELGWHAVTAADLAGFDRYPQAPYWVVNAVLSRWPLEVEMARPLRDERGDATWRHALLARVLRPDAEGGPFLVAGTHLEHGLDRSATRMAQARHLAACVAEALGDRAARTRALPAVLAGDLNAVPWSDEVRGLTGASVPLVDDVVFVDAWEAAGQTGRGDTWSSANPLVPKRAVYPDRRLDYVMVSWPRRRNSGHVAACHLAGTEPVDGVWPSDHFAVVTDVDM
ncbi:endonuclease/exonuclease/phosphatase family protein [Rhabdothermincola salaria]|uniref:endonuclease/exonuclease/phosphatase family protein n=1 Tax=Rhabdothermincola salaria TaxID=2903142 RepID=UPI001E4D5FD1|nr:endonuclease/exonuclease/phosphatase family protein [Rhabdothermincola salaria]